jgi:hypothetical protein
MDRSTQQNPRLRQTRAQSVRVDPLDQFGRPLDREPTSSKDAVWRNIGREAMEGLVKAEGQG